MRSPLTFVSPAFLGPAAAVVLLAPFAASAHPGLDAGLHHGAGLVGGLVHPFTGLDHVLAMLAVGLWSGLTARRAATAAVAPVAFVAALAVGALLAVSGSSVPAVEPGIAASLLVLGLMVATRARLGAAAGGLIAAAFAVFHGAAHGLELGGGAALAGMLVGTLCLHLAGLGLARAVVRRPALSRLLGGAVAAVGGAALLGLA